METQYINLNMTPTGVNPCFHISQYDVGRMLGFIVHSGGATVDLDTYTCTVEATRSDGTAITSAVATTDNIGTFEVTPTMSNKADKYRCQLVIVDENSKRIASLPFDMEVTKAAMDENSESIEEDASLYQQYTGAVRGAIANINADIQTEKFSRATTDASLQSQIDQIIAPSGEAPSAAEVQNARIGTDGTVYSTLGDAIRTQNSDLKNAIDEITEETRNLFNLDNIRIGKAWNGVDNTARAVLYISVTPSTQYTLSFASNPFDSINWLEKAQADDRTTTAGYVVASSPTTKTATATSNYIVIQFNKTNISKSDFEGLNIQLEYGSTATEYVKPVTAVDIIAREKIDAVLQDVEGLNINNIQNTVNEVYAGANLFKPSEYTANKEYKANGELIDSTVIGISGFIPVIQGKTMFFSVNGKEIMNYRLYYMIEFDENKAFIRRINVSTLTNYTPSADSYYVIAEVIPNLLYTLKIEYDSMTAWNQSMNASEIANSEIMATVNMFRSIAGVGDSYTAGLSARYDGTLTDGKELSYIATIGNRAGIPWFNYGVSGATTKTYISNANGLPKVLADEAHDLYILNLGQNDVNVDTEEGTIADIHDDWTLNADTFYGNYGKIIAQIKAHAPKAKLILVKSWVNHNKYGTNISYQKFDNAIQAIADYYSIPCIAPFDDRFFNSPNYQKFRAQGHPTIMGYNMMGIAMERLISKCIVMNPQYFLYSSVG